MNTLNHVTIKEIKQQPDCWKRTFEIIRNANPEIQSFLKKFRNCNDRQIIITGAGTSAYAGIVLESVIRKETQECVKAIATTDLITEPGSYFKPGATTLLVSFARSGNSPESKAAIDFADKFSSRIFHLIITCNKKGQIIVKQNDPNSLVLILPDETNDEGLAMTSSFSSMLLAGILVFLWNSISDVEKQVETLIKYGRRILDDFISDIESVSKKGFKRAVFLGSGDMTGIAQESKLKLQELTAGAVMSQHESFLAFRHGPISVVDAETLLIYLFSNDPYILKYEKDLVKSLHKGKFKLGISQHPIADVKVDKMICLSSNKTEDLCSELLPVCFVVPSQLLGFYTSLHMGMNPDAPCTDGTYSRVVQGVTIYEPVK